MLAIKDMGKNKSNSSNHEEAYNAAPNNIAFSQKTSLATAMLADAGVIQQNQSPEA